MSSLQLMVWCSGSRLFDLGEPRAPQAQILSVGAIAWPLGRGDAIFFSWGSVRGPMPGALKFIPGSPWERPRTNFPSSSYIRECWHLTPSSCIHALSGFWGLFFLSCPTLCLSFGCGDRVLGCVCVHGCVCNVRQVRTCRGRKWRTMYTQGCL